MEHLTI